MLYYGDYIDYYRLAQKNGNIQKMEYYLKMATLSCKLLFLRYRLNNTMPYFQDLVPATVIDPNNQIQIQLRMLKIRPHLKPLAEALEKAVDEAYKWNQWFLEPRFRAAKRIQYAWRKAIDNPNTKVGKSHLCRDFENFQNKFSTDFV